MCPLAARIDLILIRVDEVGMPAIRRLGERGKGIRIEHVAGVEKHYVLSRRAGRSTVAGSTEALVCLRMEPRDAVAGRAPVERLARCDAGCAAVDHHDLPGWIRLVAHGSEGFIEPVGLRVTHRHED